jgi:cobalt-zinc-cadmium efflux system outer membrane protein
MALENRADLRILTILEEQALAEAELARAEGKPDLTGSIRYTRSVSRFDQLGLSEGGAVVPLRDADNVLTFGLAIPLFTRQRAQGEVDAALSRATQARLKREHLQQTVIQEVEAAYRRWSGTRRALEILQTGVVQQSEQNLLVIREAYRLGQLRVMDVLNEQRRLVETELSFVDAQAEAAQAFAELERAVGGNLP